MDEMANIHRHLSDFADSSASDLSTHEKHWQEGMAEHFLRHTAEH